MQLPDSETLYATYFVPWMPPQDDAEPLPRSDLESIDLPPGTHPRVLDVLEPEVRRQVEEQLQRIAEAARLDFVSLLGVSGEPSADWLDALEAWATPAQLQKLWRGSDPAHLGNSYLILCCETGAILAALLRQGRPGLRWLPDWPYWESSLFDLNSRTRIPVFHWALRTLSGDERQPLREKIRATLEFLREPPVEKD
jgi:hypothetical protein